MAADYHDNSGSMPPQDKFTPLHGTNTTTQYPNASSHNESQDSQEIFFSITNNHSHQKSTQSTCSTHTNNIFDSTTKYSTPKRKTHTTTKSAPPSLARAPISPTTSPTSIIPWLHATPTKAHPPIFPHLPVNPSQLQAYSDVMPSIPFTLPVLTFMILHLHQPNYLTESQLPVTLWLSIAHQIIIEHRKAITCGTHCF